MTDNLVKTVVTMVICAASMLAASQPARAATEDKARFMETAGRTSQPIGHFEFCKVYRDECSQKTANVSPAQITAEGWKRVHSINAEVNRKILPLTDSDNYGRDEVWTYPAQAGDCEDYALLKRRELMAAGLAATDLLVTVVRQPNGEGHAVLTLRSTDGDFILDNLEREVKSWSDTPYHYIKRQDVADTGRWEAIANCNDDVLVGGIGK